MKTMRLFAISMLVASASAFASFPSYATAAETNASATSETADELKQDFIDSLQKGLERRWACNDEKNRDDRTPEETQEYYETLVSMEYDSIEEYKDLVTGDEKFDEILKQYFRGIEKQVESTENFRSLVDFTLSDDGSFDRAQALLAFESDYGLKLTDSARMDYEQLVYAYNGSIPALGVIEIEDTGIEYFPEYDDSDVYIEVRNVSNEAIIGLTVSGTASNGETVIFMQEHSETKIMPDETARLYQMRGGEMHQDFEVDSYSFASEDGSHYESKY